MPDSRLPLTAAAVAAALALPGCLNDDSIYSSGGDKKVKRVTRTIVLRNLTALARGDGRAFCSTYTPQFLRTYRNGYDRCVASFKERDPAAAAPRLRFTNFLTASDDKVAVAFEPVAGGSEQTYYLQRTTPPPQVGGGKRWLIDQEAVER